MTEDELFDLSDEELEAQMKSEAKAEEVSEEIPGDEPENVDEDSTEEELDENQESEEESEDEVEEDDSETSEEEEGQPDGEPDTTEDDNEDEPTDTPPEYRDLKVDGKMIPINSIDELYALASGGGNLTQKYQKMSGHKKSISIMEQHNISDEDLSVLAQIRGGNKDALAALVKSSGIDYMDVTDEVSAGYNPAEFIPSDTSMSIKEVQDEISVDPEYSITQNVVNNVMDEKSQGMLVQNPNMIRGLHQDIKNGVYEEVQAKAYKMKVMEGGTRSDMEYYIAAAQSEQPVNNQAPVQNQTPARNETQEQVTKPNLGKAKSKRAAGSTKAKVAPKTVVDVNEMTDDELDAYRAKIMDA